MYRGQYKSTAPNGLPYYYVAGDTVLYQGRLYEAINPTQMSPIQSPLSWKFIGATENFIAENPPLFPVNGQVWISTAGRSYVWFNDPNGSQWIET